MSTRNTFKFLYPIKWIGNWKYPATPSFRVIWTVWQWRVKRRNNILFRTPTSINCCSCCYLGGCLATRSRCSFFVFCCCECVPAIPVTFTRVLRVKQRCAHLLNAANERRKKTWNTKRQMWIGSHHHLHPRIHDGRLRTVWVRGYLIWFTSWIHDGDNSPKKKAQNPGNLA